MYSTSVKIVTSYKAINLPYENNVSSSSLLWFSSTPFPFAPDFCLYLSWIQHLPDEKWMQIEDLEKIRQKTSNHRLWVTFFFPFFPRWSQEGSYTSGLWLIDLYLIVFTASFPLFPDSGKPQSPDLHLALRISCWIKQFFPVDSWSNS